jgi:glyoxylase-like metal-dependent hydrolase (beta-lactamase superfamily II)
MENDFFRFQIGHFNCLVIQDRHDGDHIVSPRNVLFVHTGQQQIIIDPGLGHDLIPGSPYQGVLRDKLLTVGISSAEVDLILLSHADLDHVSGAVDEIGHAVFPNARCALLREEAAFWSSSLERLLPNDAYDEELRRICHDIPRARLQQLRDKLQIVDSEAEVVPGVRVIAASGHTPGHTAIAISSDDESLLFIGDLVYTPQDFENPDWYSIYDFDPKQAIATRQRVFAQAVREHQLLMAYHLPFPGLGYVTQEGSGWRWIEH